MKPDSGFQPPWLLRRSLDLLLSPGEREEKSGDLEEVYQVLAADEGRLRAGIWYLLQVLKVAPRGLTNHVRWSSVMFINYLRIAWRNVIRHKVQSFISIFGLALGLAGTFLIMLWVLDEISFDKFHENAELVYRAEFQQNYSGQMFQVNVSPHPLGTRGQGTDSRDR